MDLLDHNRATLLLKLLAQRQSASMIAAYVVVLMALNWLLAGLLLRAFQFEASARGFNISNATFQAVSVIGLVMLMLPGPILAIRFRDWRLRRLVRGRIQRMDCIFCSYPLASLEVVKSVICCPECGTNHRAFGAHAAMIPASILDQPHPARRHARKSNMSLESVPPELLKSAS